MNCDYCTKDGIYNFSFLKADGVYVPIRGCYEHLHLAQKEQGRVSMEDRYQENMKRISVAFDPKHMMPRAPEVVVNAKGVWRVGPCIRIYRFITDLIKRHN